MNAHYTCLVAAGDVGGSRAILPALHELVGRGERIAILSHGSLGKEVPDDWPRVSPEQALAWGKAGSYSAFVLGTSVADQLPLRLAREAQALRLPVVCVLDNWMNYRRRLEADGHPMLIPDTYAVMDELARAEAIEDGIPSSCLRVVGQPALSSLRSEYLICPREALRREVLGRSGWGASDRKLLAFISEPAEADQGAHEGNPSFRGYTEKTVLELLAKCLQPYASRVQVGLVPHPREDAAGLLAVWDRCRGNLIGGRMPVKTGREATFIADGICGMASLLLYEGLLLGKPVLSLQPGLRAPHLEFLRKKGLVGFVTTLGEARSSVDEWCSRIAGRASPARAPFHPEIRIHERAAKRLADIVARVGRSEGRRGVGEAALTGLPRCLAAGSGSPNPELSSQSL